MDALFGKRAAAWLQMAAGAAGGLFLARLALEAAERPSPRPLIVAVGLLAALGGLVLFRWLARRGLLVWPAILLLAYVVWPRRDPLAAGSVALLALLVWLLGGRRLSLHRRAEMLADVATFALALVTYVATAAPDVLPADAGEFQLVAALLGVAHPFGFPLYTMVGHLFVRLLPVGTPAYRLNLMSGVLAAGTLVLVARATRHWARRLGGSRVVALTGGLAAALALGTATTFWAQATIANIRTPTAFFAALALLALSRFSAASSASEADRALTVLGLALGLGGSHHPSLAFSAVFYVVYVLLVDPRLVVQPRRWWRPALVGVAGLLLPLIYLPVRGAMGAALAPEDLDTVQGFVWHVTAAGFRGDMFAFANATDLPHRLALLPTLFPFQFNVVLLLAAVLGLVGLLWRDRRLFTLLAGSLALHTFVSITYRAPQTVEYLMPAYLPTAVAVGLLPSLFFTRGRTGGVLFARSVASPLLASVTLWAGLLNGLVHGPSLAELARDHTARETVAPLLEAAPEGARILADWRWVTPLWYLQQLEGLRSDVEVVYVHPVHGEDYGQTWLRRIQETPPERPVLLTHFFEFSGYTSEPWATGFLIRPRPATEAVAPLEPVEVTFGDQVEALGYGLVEDRSQPGQVVELRLAWRSTGVLGLSPSFTVRLTDGEGRDWAQADRWLGTDCAPGEARFERLFLPLYPALPPGRYLLTLGAYTVTESGFETLPTGAGEASVTLTSLQVEPSERVPFTLHRRAVPVGGGPTLVGVDYDRSVPDVLRVYLHWQGPAGPGWHARLRNDRGAEVTAPLVPIPDGTYQTVALDLPDTAGASLLLSVTDGDGESVTAAGPWAWPLTSVRLPRAPREARFVSLGDEMVLVGSTAEPPVPGDTMLVDVALVARRPLTSDDATSVRVVDGDGRLLGQHDSQLALGAIPTLKWIRGSYVVDRHLLPLRDDSGSGEMRATLVAYERFRMTPLLAMDDRFDAIPLGTWARP